MTPLDRFTLDAKRLNFLVDDEFTQEVFFVEVVRKVSKTNVFSLNKLRFEAPVDVRKQAIEVRYDRQYPHYVIVYYQGKRLGQSAKLDVLDKTLEKALIEHMFAQARQHKTLFTLIDEAHLLPTDALLRLRLLVDKFPKKHNLVLFGQSDLMHYLSLAANADIKSRIPYSNHLQQLTDVHLTEFIERELTTANMGVNTFTEGAMELILRNANGNLRLCKNIAYGSLMEAARNGVKEVTINHVNAILIQPHWRTHKELITQQVPK